MICFPQSTPHTLVSDINFIPVLRTLNPRLLGVTINLDPVRHVELKVGVECSFVRQLNSWLNVLFFHIAAVPSAHRNSLLP